MSDPDGGDNSDPVCVRSAPETPAWQSNPARPVPVGAMDVAPSAPGGFYWEVNA